MGKGYMLNLTANMFVFRLTGLALLFLNIFSPEQNLGSTRLKYMIIL